MILHLCREDEVKKKDFDLHCEIIENIQKP